MDFQEDDTEYGFIEVTESQYRFVADRLCKLFKDKNKKAYRMLLLELGEKEVLNLLALAYIHAEKGYQKDVFWSLVDFERTRKKDL